MNIVVINGTEIRGCTYQMKEFFLSELREGNTITEFYLPKDGPAFCLGCKTCFMKDEALCPHAAQVQPIWSAIMNADLLVFAYPVYVMRAPGQLKTLLDHFGAHWIAHRPKKEMFTKRAVILTQSVGAPNKGAQSDVETSLNWMGVSDVKKFGLKLMEGVIWPELSEKKRKDIETKTKAFAHQFLNPRVPRMSLKVRLYFLIGKITQKMVLSRTLVPSVDTRYWLDQGWIKR